MPEKALMIPEDEGVGLNYPGKKTTLSNLGMRDAGEEWDQEKEAAGLALDDALKNRIASADDSDEIDWGSENEVTDTLISKKNELSDAFTRQYEHFSCFRSRG